MSLTLMVQEFNDRGLRTVVTSYQDQSLAWDVKPYAKASRIDGTTAVVGAKKDLVFKEINAYLASLSETKQAKIWAIYVKLHTLVNESQDLLRLKSKFQDLIQQIYDEVTYEDLSRWCSTSSMIIIPLNIKSEYDENVPKETTYLRSDYFDLLVLAIATRMLVPLWGEYITRIKGDVGTTHREYEAVKLTYKSALIRWEPYLRLYRYMERSVDNKAKASILQSATLSGIPTDEFPDWLLANTLVKRTSVVPLDVTHDGPNIVTDAYAFVSSTLRSTGHKRFSGSVTDKESDRNDKKEQKESPAEAYKIKQQIADGETAQASVYVEDYIETLVLSLAPDIDTDQLQVCLDAMQRLEGQFLPLPHQIGLTQWVAYMVVNPGYVRMIRRSALLKLMAGVQAILWHWGFNDLAALLTAREVQKDDDEFLSTQETWSKIPNHLMDELLAICKHAIPSRSKSTTARQTNVGAISVETMYRLLADRDWYLQCPPALFALAGHVPHSPKMYVPSDIRTQLATLLIRLHKERIDFRARRQVPEDDLMEDDDSADIQGLVQVNTP